MQETPEKQKRRIDVAKIKTAIVEAISEQEAERQVEITSVLLALAEVTKEFTVFLIRALEGDEEN